MADNQIGKYNKVVLKFKNNRIIKGTVLGWGPTKPSFFVQNLEGESINVKLDELKAVFFVKDHNGDNTYKETYNDYIPGEGVKLFTKFSDGECITGYSPSYSSSRPGFMIAPADRQSNNIRIFVVRSATAEVARILH